MPTYRDCIHKHREGKNTECGSCSVSSHYNLDSINDFENMRAEILGKVIALKKTNYISPMLKSRVTLMIWESGMNAIEHGVLGIGSAEKEEMQKKLGGHYWAYIEKKWMEKNVPIGLSVCLNHDRLLVGAHDPGQGFDFGSFNLSAEQAPDKDPLKSCGRGISLLKGSGIYLHWNDKGNSILCSLKLAMPLFRIESSSDPCALP